MKRMIFALTAFAMLLSMTGCGIGSLSSGNAVLPTAPPAQPSEPLQTSGTAEPTQTEPLGPTQPEETEPVMPTYQIPLTAITMPQIRETDTTETGEAVFTYTYPDITFLHQDAEVARSVLLDLRNRLDSTRTEADTLKASAQRVYRETSVAPGYRLDVSCQTMRVDQSILSLLMSQSAVSGNGQNQTASQAVTYDLVTGNALTLSQLLAQDADIDQLCRMLVDALSGTEGLFGGYEYTVEDLFAGNTLPDNWYLSTQGLCFYFAPYEIAPYAMGTVTATLPYDTLNGVIKDRYYPAETPEASGSMQVMAFEDADLTQFSAFAELILEDTDSAYLFYPTEAVTELRIEQVAYSEETGGYVAYNTAFATDVLTAGQAVRVQYVFPGMLASLRVSYFCNGQQHAYYLCLSGEDGSVYLSDTNA